ncbi:MAG TPA: helix-turn-helix domain-containing protein [Roseateles sp.]
MSLRQLLTATLERRRAVNPAYSLRAFAKSLGVHHATLTRLLAGRTVAKDGCVQRLGRRLGLSVDDIRQLGLAEARRGVCRAITRRDFRPDSRWLAAVTGLPVDAVNVALQRLLVDRVLVMRSRGDWFLQSPPTESPR